MKTFGLRNQRGSCWVNATLQAIFRIPEIQQRLEQEEHDPKNAVETCIQEIWSSSGDEGLKQFYQCVKTATMPAGDGIGDSHELLEFVCDKVPFLDKLFRFKVGNMLKCQNCDYTDIRRDSMIEFPIVPSHPKQSVSEAVTDATNPITINDWTCEKCKGKGCKKRLLFGTFPQILTFHVTSLNTSVTYTSKFDINGHQYFLFAIICFNGGHWWTHGRDLPPGKPWFTFDDTHITNNGPMQFPVSDSMRLLLYSRINE